MKISASFTKQFEWETLQSEKLRAAILAAYAAFSFIYILCISLIVNNQSTSIDNAPVPVTLLAFLTCLFIYEYTVNRILNYRLKRFKTIHRHFKYLTALVEVGIITAMLYVYSIYFKKNSLLSDVVMVSLYYLLVFLSSFYLDKIISLVTGTVAAVAYTILNLMEQENISPSAAGELMYNRHFIYATGILLFFCGIAAAFMANQLRKGIMRTVELVEDENKLFNLFSRQISTEVAKELMDNDGKVISQRRFVSVMFIDIRNFTVYAETQTAEDLVKFQNCFFSVIIDIVHNYHGIVNQFLGDGAMITFGAPIEIDNPPQYAIKAALEIKQKLEDCIAKNEMHKFEIGVGIHCGMAVTGNIGSNLKSEYSITGGVVILAARIEQFNKQLNSHILISREAYDYANLPEIKFEHAAEATLKGWSHPVELYKLA